MEIFNIDAVLFSIPFIIIFSYSVWEFFLNELRFTKYHSSIREISKKSNVIRELCHCKSKISNTNPKYKCTDRCPIIIDLPELTNHTRIIDEIRTPFLTVKDIKDVHGLAAKLKYPCDTVSRYIYDNNEDIRILLDKYVFIKEGENKFRLVTRSPGFIKKGYYEFRKKLILFFWGEWHPRSRSTWMSDIPKKYACPSDIYENLAYRLSIILNEKVIYNSCIYRPNRFPDLEQKLTLYDRSKLETTTMSGNMPYRCIQLNRIVLDANYTHEIKNADYMNFIWRIFKVNVILGSKQSQYLELTAVQLLGLGILTLTSEAVSLILLKISGICFLITGLIILIHNLKEKPEPYGWFKNRYVRVFAIFVFLILGYLYILFIELLSQMITKTALIPGL